MTTVARDVAPRHQCRSRAPLGTKPNAATSAVISTRKIDTSATGTTIASRRRGDQVLELSTPFEPVAGRQLHARLDLLLCFCDEAPEIATANLALDDEPALAIFPD